MVHKFLPNIMILAFDNTHISMLAAADKHLVPDRVQQIAEGALHLSLQHRVVVVVAWHIGLW